MHREVIVDIGKTGFGKSLWAKCFIKGYRRLFVYDPLMSYDVPFVSGEMIVDEMVDKLEFYENPSTNFRLGIFDVTDLEKIGNLAFVLQNTLLLIEECSTVFDKGLRNLPQWARRIIFLGRHQAVSIMLVAQRAVSIPIDFRTQANRIVTFQQHEGDDLGWLQGFFGTEKCREMPFLPKLDCYDYWNGEIKRYSIKEQVRRELGITVSTESVFSI